MDTQGFKDKNRYHILSSFQKRILLIISIFVIVFVIPAFGHFYYSFAINRPAQNDKEMMFVIEKGTSVSEIASNLYLAGLVNSENLFKLYVYLNNLTKSIQAGSYVVPQGTSIVNLVRILQNGTDDVTLTFLEGWRVEEFALHASKNLQNIDYEDFVNIAKDKEGYLFPDTYFLNASIDEEQLISILTSTHEQKTSKIFSLTPPENIGLTKEQVMIFASILEREVFDPIDRPIVAGILINRFRENELIGADATTQYVKATYYLCQEASSLCPSEEVANAIDWWPLELTATDLEIDSPYNTRKNFGLPPAPISNPGISSIQAVLNYEDTDFRYYLHDSTGKTYFATTLEQHNNNVANYLR